MFRGRVDEIIVSFGYIRVARILRSDVQLLLHISTSSSGGAGYGGWQDISVH
jgi:hypothetical protein